MVMTHQMSSLGWLTAFLSSSLSESKLGSNDHWLLDLLTREAHVELDRTDRGTSVWEWINSSLRMLMTMG